MSDINITVRFFRDMQPAQYEKAGAEVTFGIVSNDPKHAAGLLEDAQKLVLAAVGKGHEFRSVSGPKAVASTITAEATAGGGDAPGAAETPTVAEPASETKRRGRPPKADKPVTKDALDDALAAAAGKPEPSPEAIAGVDVEVKVEAKDLPEVTVEEMQTACSKAAMELGSADKVRALYKTNYRVDRVAEIEPDYRRPFLKDLKAMVDKELAAKKGA